MKQEWKDLKRNKLENQTVKNIIIESKIIIIVTLKKSSRWYRGCILRERINELKDSTEGEVSRSQHSKTKEEIMGPGGQDEKFRTIFSGSGKRKKGNGKKIMLTNKMTNNFPEMKGMKT